MSARVEGRDRSSEAVAGQRDLVASGLALDGVDRPRQIGVDVGFERVVGVALVGDAPVEHEHVEPLSDEELDGAVAGAQIEDVAPADEAEDDQDGLRVPDLATVIAPELGTTAAPDDVLGSCSDLRPARSGDEPDAVSRP